MKKGKILIIIDSIINLFLGMVLLAYSEPIIKLFGLPVTEQYFYPNILGAILFGIGIALYIEYRGKGDFIGLGLGGAISINMMGGIVLFAWLVFGNINTPIHGKIILWVLDMILIGISILELFAYLKRERKHPSTTTVQ
ncbi:MAG: hypothetical protein KQI35_10000 [Bacteroidetes bacterium]|nr:hypothetical protein [Bacteroidota bacterium]